MGKGRIIIRQTSMLRKQAGQMHKLLGLWDKKPGYESNSNPMPKPLMTKGVPDFLVDNKGLHTRHVTRRQIVMNRHFTEIISDVLANDLKKGLSEIGVRITSIETKAWNKGVRVFYSMDRSFDESTHDELNSLITQLRSVVTERQLIGRTPMINFVYDRDAEFERDLGAAFEQITLEAPKQQTDVVKQTSNEMLASRTNNPEKPKLVPRHFFAPEDMSNMTLGLNYASLYDEVASKLERGRAQSSRMKENVTLMSQQPMFRVPQEDLEQDDPTQRVQKMQKFIISQRKKSEIVAKVRRQKELLLRDLVKWDVAEEETEESRDTDQP